jgi:hypothetical protein
VPYIGSARVIKKMEKIVKIIVLLRNFEPINMDKNFTLQFKKINAINEILGHFRN